MVDLNGIDKEKEDHELSFGSSGDKLDNGDRATLLPQEPSSGQLGTRSLTNSNSKLKKNKKSENENFSKEYKAISFGNEGSLRSSLTSSLPRTSQTSRNDSLLSNENTSFRRSSKPSKKIQLGISGAVNNDWPVEDRPVENLEPKARDSAGLSSSEEFYRQSEGSGDQKRQYLETVTEGDSEEELESKKSFENKNLSYKRKKNKFKRKNIDYIKITEKEEKPEIEPESEYNFSARAHELQNSSTSTFMNNLTLIDKNLDFEGKLEKPLSPIIKKQQEDLTLDLSQKARYSFSSQADQLKTTEKRFPKNEKNNLEAGDLEMDQEFGRFSLKVKKLEAVCSSKDSLINTLKSKLEKVKKVDGDKIDFLRASHSDEISKIQILERRLDAAHQLICNLQEKIKKRKKNSEKKVSRNLFDKNLEPIASKFGSEINGLLNFDSNLLSKKKDYAFDQPSNKMSPKNSNEDKIFFETKSVLSNNCSIDKNKQKEDLGYDRLRNPMTMSQQSLPKPRKYNREVIYYLKEIDKLQNENEELRFNKGDPNRLKFYKLKLENRKLKGVIKLLTGKKKREKSSKKRDKKMKRSSKVEEVNQS